MKYINECREMGISVLPPDVNSSDRNFTPAYRADKLAIRFGLCAVRNLGEGAADCIIKARDERAVPHPSTISARAWI